MAEHEPEDIDESPADRKVYRHCAPDRFRVRLDLAYDGTDYAGWQRQTSQTTLQGTIEAAVRQLFGEALSVVGASRTDAGVHALMQVAHFDAAQDPRRFRDLRYSLQCLTPDTLVIKQAYLAPHDFHAIACATQKTYRYSILNRRVPSAHRHRTTWWIRQPLDLDQLNAASQMLVGTHDFKSFQTAGTPTETTVRRVDEARWVRDADDTLIFTIRGEGFLKQMVRNIVGCLVDLQLNARPPEDMARILAAHDRRAAGNTAAPQGLFLVQVDYPPELDKRCLKL